MYPDQKGLSILKDFSERKTHLSPPDGQASGVPNFLRGVHKIAHPAGGPASGKILHAEKNAVFFAYITQKTLKNIRWRCSAAAQIVLAHDMQSIKIRGASEFENVTRAWKEAIMEAIYPDNRILIEVNMED